MNAAASAWFENVNAAARGRLLGLLQSWFPAGHVEGREFRCGNLQGQPGKSFAVNLETGVWTDFATGERGGSDPISLYAALRGLQQGKAATQLGRDLGLERPKPKAVRDTWTPITPIPAGAPNPASVKHSWSPNGTPGDGWLYQDIEGRPLMWRVRFDLADGGKTVHPLTWCHDETGATMWRWKDLPTPRPLYNLPGLRSYPEKPVLIAEGEKTADAAGRILPGWVVVTWPGGAKRTASADWTPLKGRATYLWADADDPGKRAMLEIAAILEKLND